MFSSICLKFSSVAEGTGEEVEVEDFNGNIKTCKYIVTFFFFEWGSIFSRYKIKKSGIFF